MAIIGPEQLPLILKVPSDPVKFEILSTLGHPTVMVELTETQLEQAIRITGDFIAQYFPYEEKIAFFNTQPLVNEYPLPPDAYMIRDVKWDPATTRIGDIFGAESFLFCFPRATRIMDKDGSMQDIREWDTSWKAKTPFGSRRLNIFKRNSKHHQPARKIEYDGGSIVTTINHPMRCVNKQMWLNNDEFEIGDMLEGVDDSKRISGFKTGGLVESYSVDVPKAQCLYVAHDGDPVLVH